jgi:all-trans-retinol 13,14-reductase
MSETAYDTVVIGGGVSGLVCALLQARKGQRVMLVEKAAHLSPTLWGFERQGTYFDTGFHYAGSVGEEGLFNHLLRLLAMEEDLTPDMECTEVYDRVRFQAAGYDVPFAQGWEALEAGLTAVYPQEKQGITAFLRSIRSLWEEGRTAFKTDFGQSLGPLFTKEGRNLRDSLLDLIRDRHLQAVLGCHAILYGSSAQATSLMFHSQVVGSYYESACVYRGGGRHWVKVFAKALQQAGVAVHCGYGVSRILLDADGRFQGVEREDETIIRATCCISTVHPKTLLTLLPEGSFRPAYCHRIDSLQETASAVVLFGRGVVSQRSGNLILIDEPESVWDWQDRPIAERPLFVSAAHSLDAGGVSIICPATLADVPDSNEHEPNRRPSAYKAWKQQIAAALLERLANYAGDVIHDFELLDTASPLTFRDWIGSPAGGIYGVQHRQEDMPLMPRTHVPGLYLSGQAIVAPGVLGAMCAGFLTESCVA